MGIAPAIVTYIIIWWCVFFAVLPQRVTSQAKSGEVAPGTDPGAPADPRMWWKVRLTTAITTGLWLLVFLAVTFGIIDVAAYIEALNTQR